MREAKANVYSVPPTNRLHYVLVKVSSRTYVVAEYNGPVGLPDSDVFPAQPIPNMAARQWQRLLEFEIVTKPMGYMKAVDTIAYLTSKRIKDRPIILNDQESNP